MPKEKRICCRKFDQNPNMCCNYEYDKGHCFYRYSSTCIHSYEKFEDIVEGIVEANIEQSDNKRES